MAFHADTRDLPRGKHELGEERTNGSPESDSDLAYSDKLRQTPGYIEQLESDAAHPEDATAFADWTNPTADNESSA